VTETKTAKEAKETGPKNIYAKMATVKSKLLGIKKGGKNDFSHYSYFELGDILPILTPALEEERLYMKTEFSATEQIAKLIIFDIDVPESKIDFEIRFAECALKGAHEIQNLGAAQTYTRRYLIMTAFDVAEADVVDAGAERDEKKETERKGNKPPATKTQQTPPADTTPQDKDLGQVRREAWELIKKLPQEKQADWIKSCQGADRKTLNEIIKEVNEILCAPPQETVQKESRGKELANEASNQRLEDLKGEFFTLLETLPQGTQKAWLDAGYDADEATMEVLIPQIKQQIAAIEEAKKAPPKTQKTAPAKPTANPANEVQEIY
jgi:hypothetical protein